MHVQRYLKNSIWEDALADGKMAFISGPRQVGKTHLAKQCLKSSANYFNWDVTEFKHHWIRSPLKAIEKIGDGPVVFDELHKYPHWKNSLKGLYDQVGGQVPIIVTGSARLDLYKKGGDSLLGRYIPYRLHLLLLLSDLIFPVTPINWNQVKSITRSRILLPVQDSPSHYFSARKEKPAAGPACGWSSLFEKTSGILKIYAI